jgi:DNA-binding response OmpR family regulator
MAGHRPDAGPVPARDGGISVLLAEHEPEVAEMSARYLRRDGLRVRLVTSPELALAELTAGPDAVAVVDLTMPGLDPRRIRRALRTPAIFLVADSKGLRPRGLAGRAALPRQWLARPFSPRQLVEMVRDVLSQAASQPGLGSRGVHVVHGSRRAQAVPAPPADRSAPGFRLIGASRTAVTEGHHVPLTTTEFAVLAAMLDNPGRVLSRRQLLVAAGRPRAGDRAADVHIAQIRAKIGAVCAIRTIRGAGYAVDP